MKNQKFYFVRIISLTVIAMWLVGCADLDYAVRNGAIPKGKSIVFGSIAVGSAEANWQNSARVKVINARNSKVVINEPIKGPNTPFYWSLPPGQYAILDLEESWSPALVVFLNGNRFTSRRIFAEFSIESEQTVVYVGTLDLTSPLPSVADDFDPAVKVFHTQFPAVSTEPIKQLLRFERQE